MEGKKIHERNKNKKNVFNETIYNLWEVAKNGIGGWSHVNGVETSDQLTGIEYTATYVRSITRNSAFSNIRLHLSLS